MSSHDAYRALPGVNWSSLKAMGKSPLHYRHGLENPPADSPTFKFGRLFHSLILEPEKVEAEYVVIEKAPTKCNGPDWDAYQAGQFVCLPVTVDGKTFKTRSGNAYKEYAAAMSENGVAIFIPSEITKFDEYAAYLALIDGRDIVTEAQMRDAQAMADAVRAAMPGLLSSLDNIERTLEWVDADTGIACKCRIDCTAMEWNGQPVLADLKSAADISERGFNSAVAKYGYAAQAAFYLDGARANGIDARGWAWLAVEKPAPHDCAFIYASEEMIEAGRNHYKALLRRMAECRRDNHWPGQHPNAITLDPLPWMDGMPDPDQEIEV